MTKLVATANHDNEVNDVAILTEMKQCRLKVDKLLTDFAAYASSKQYPISDKNAENFVSITDIKTDAFRTGKDLEAFKEAILKFGLDSKGNKANIHIPISRQIDNYVLNIPDVGIVKDYFFNNNVTISVGQISEICLEVPYVNEGFHNASIDDREIAIDLLDPGELYKLKKTNVKEWMKLQSNIQYTSLMQQIYQILADLDLQLDTNTINKLAEQSLCTALALVRCQSLKRYSTEVVESFFGKNDAGRFVVKLCEDRSTRVNCLFGRRCWGSQYGIGVNIETNFRFVIFWQPKAQYTEDDTKEMKNREQVALLDCKLCQGFPLYFPLSEEKGLELLVDCLSHQYDHHHHIAMTESMLLPDMELAQLSLSFCDLEIKDESKYRNKNSPHPNEISEMKNEAKSLSDVVNSIQMDTTDKECEFTETEILTWGKNRHSEKSENSRILLGCVQPELVYYSPLSCLEPVKSIECSMCHTLLLTKFGSVYSCGDGSDGQLGHQSLESYRMFHPISWFHNHDNRIILTQVSAGSNETCSHSAAIDSNHNIYTWGKSILCGHKKYGQSEKSQITVPRKVKALENQCILQVSCGGGFTLVRALRREDYEPDTKSSNIQVYSWGFTSMGRLGHGKDPSTFTESPRQKVPWCQCSPTLMKTFINETVEDVSAGMTHALANNSKGEVFAWGSNIFGQCSVTRRKVETANTTQQTNLWNDIWIPQKLLYFGNSSQSIRAKLVFAGSIHSAVLNFDGKVYSWGGGGNGDCLGHGDISSTYEYGISENADNSFRQFKTMSGDLQPPKWALPRMIQGLKDYRISKLSLGFKHGAALTDSGNMYMWGDSLHQENNESNLRGKNQVPSHPGGEYLRPLLGKRISLVACGNDNTFCVTTGDVTAWTTGQALLRECHQITSTRIQPPKMPLVDCILICSGRKIPCHKIIIASRSVILQKMLLEEERRPNQYSIEVIVPGIQYSTMKYLVKFLYTDSIDITCTSTFTLLVNLWKAAQHLEVENLESTCKYALSAIYEFNTQDILHGMVPRKHSKSSTLSKDLGNFFLMQDPRWADVKIITNDDKQVIYAHQCILQYSCFYDIVKLDSQNVEESKLGNRGITTIEVSGSNGDILRLILFIYTGGSINKGIETNTEPGEKNIRIDLINAGKYQLSAMKAHCENSIEVNAENALDILLLSTKVQSTKLKVMALNTICKTMKHLDTSKMNYNTWKLNLSKCPADARIELFEKIKDVHGVEAVANKARKDIALISLDRSRKKKEKVFEMMANDINNSEKDGLTMWRLMVLVGAMIIYFFLQKYLHISQSIMMFVNVVVLFTTIVYLFLKIT